MSLKQITYASITSDMGEVLSKGATPSVSLFSDSDGVTAFTDANGNTCSDKTITSINYTEPHNNADSTQVVNGYLTLHFTDGSSIEITDNVNTVYYNIVAVPFQPRRF
jgi:hypothetical protein|uniref:Uncharacterized protein n=1 Tax=viral metagenome TaxID=1070528 RepID=A0A6C0JQX8_9ZZZZ